jgi:hypothetical protein
MKAFRLLALPVLALLALPARAADEVTPPSLSPPDTWLPRSEATLRVLDKISAQATTVHLRVGATTTVESLTITLRACAVRPQDLPQDSAAMLDIADSRPGMPDFHGWMFSGEPALAMLEHPVYGVRLVRCQ